MITDLTLGENIFNSPDLSIKMKILHAVNKSLDQITVAEICRNAGISRQTFYRHFESKYDIPWWYSIFCRQFYLNEIGRTIDWKTGYYHHLRLIAQERDFFRESIQYSINTPFGQTIMPENRKAVLLDTLENYRHVEVNDNLRFIVEVFSKLECEVMNDMVGRDSQIFDRQLARSKSAESAALCPSDMMPCVISYWVLSGAKRRQIQQLRCCVLSAKMLKWRDVYLKLTRHNGRAGKHGTYNPKHNDRSFNLANSEHIDPERVKGNHLLGLLSRFPFGSCPTRPG